jgi:rare lipoprotein A
LFSWTSCAAATGVPSAHIRPSVVKKSQRGFVQRGTAAWYGEKFHGRKTASGERFDMHKFTAAHRTLAFNTMVKVTNLRTKTAVVVRINDRGPFGKKFVIDLSRAAAHKIGIDRSGTAPVLIELARKGNQ